jgi:hypothetical protein
MTLITYYINYYFILYFYSLLSNTCTNTCFTPFVLQLIERRCLGHVAARAVAGGVSYGLMLHLCTYGL